MTSQLASSTRLMALPSALRAFSAQAGGLKGDGVGETRSGAGTGTGNTAEMGGGGGGAGGDGKQSAIDQQRQQKEQRDKDTTSVRVDDEEETEFFKATDGDERTASSSSSSSSGSAAGGGGSMGERIYGLFGWGVMAAAAAFIVSMYQLETDDVERFLATLENVSSASVDGQQQQEQSMSFASLVGVPLVSRYLALRHYVHGFTDPHSEKLLPDLPPHLQNITYTLVLDLDETIICSDWLRKRGWRTFKRPGVDEFIDRMGQMYELVVYTPTLFTYANPILDRLDPKGYIPQTHRLYRDANQMKHGQFMRDISKLNRNLKRVIYITADKASTQMQPDNSIVIEQFKIDDNDMSKSASDTVLLDLMPFLEAVVRQQAPDVRVVISSYDGKDIPSTFRQRTQELQMRMRERSASSSSSQPLLKRFIGR